MGYDKTTKLITKPIDTTDIAAALGVTSGDVGTLCTSEEINIMARYKPIKFAKWSELTERDIISAHDPADNIFFGIKITGTPNGVFDPTIAEFHNAQFTYIRPEGGAASPYRMTDFNNYKHDAKPNPNASFNIDSRDGGLLVGYVNDKDDHYGSLMGIEVGYDVTNIYGVDFTAMYSDGDGETGESLQNNLKRSYPCILITDEATGKSYFTALDYPAELGQKSVARPLFFDGTGVSSQNWSVRFEKPTYDNGVNMGVSAKAPWQAFKEGLKATLFLVKSWDDDGPYLDALHSQNFHEYWMEVSAQSIYQGAARPIVLPADILGAPLKLLKRGASLVWFKPTGVAYEERAVSVLSRMEGTLTNTVTVECIAEVTGGIRAVKIFNVSMGGFIALFTENELGVLFTPGDEYTIKVTLITTDSEGSATESGTFTFTA